jgi:hypothetical protein
MCGTAAYTGSKQDRYYHLICLDYSKKGKLKIIMTGK